MDNNYTLRAFERSLALYKSRVHEVFFANDTTGRGIMDTVLQEKPDKPTILVIEDNADEWFMIRWMLLQQFPEAEFVWISNPPQVLPYLESCVQYEKELPRLIFLDLYLPSAKLGLTILQMLKSHALYQRIPAITLSRSSDPEDMASALHHSSTCYIVKPTTYQEWREGFSLLHRYW